MPTAPLDAPERQAVASTPTSPAASSSSSAASEEESIRVEAAGGEAGAVAAATAADQDAGEWQTVGEKKGAREGGKTRHDLGEAVLDGAAAAAPFFFLFSSRSFAASGGRKGR